MDRYADILSLRGERPAAQRRFADLADDRIKGLELDLLSHPLAYEHGNPAIKFGWNRRRCG